MQAINPYAHALTCCQIKIVLSNEVHMSQCLHLLRLVHVTALGDMDILVFICTFALQ